MKNGVITNQTYRAACKTPEDADFIVIQSESALFFQDFVNALLQMGVGEALYLDMTEAGTMDGTDRQPTALPSISLITNRHIRPIGW